MMPPERAVANLRDLMLLFRRRRWFIAIGTVLGTAIALVLAVASEPQYTAKAAVVIDPQDTAVAGMKSATTSLDTSPVTMSTQVSVLKSREHMAQVVEDLQLIDDPALHQVQRQNRFFGWLPSGSMETVMDVAVEWLDRTGIAESLAAVDFEVETATLDIDQEKIIDAFSKRYLVRQVNDSQVINISFVHPERKQAAEIVNRAAEIYVDQLLREKADEADRMAKWVTQRLKDLSHTVQVAESELERFRADQGLIEVGDGRAEAEQITRLRIELATANAELSELQSQAAIISQLEQSADIDGMLGVLRSPMLNSLRDQEVALSQKETELSNLFGPRHPQIILLTQEKKRLNERIAQEINRLRFDLNNKMRMAQTRISNSEQHITEFERNLENRRINSLGLNELEREADANRQLVQLFREYYKTINEQQSIIESDAHVLTYAKPPSRPSTLSPNLFTILGFTISLAGSSLLALLLESIDRRVRSARQLERRFGLPVLDAVPKIKNGKTPHAPYYHLLSKPRSAYAEAVRSIYATLRLSIPIRGSANTLMVTSSIAGEGKSTLSVSLATIAVEWGQRVLVVDLDLRHPSIARSVGTRVHTGIVELIKGETTIVDAVYPTKAGFDIVGVEYVPPNPAGIIGDPRMKRLLDSFRSTYDLVILDTAPILAVSDGRITAQFADQVIVAAQWLSTPLSAVRRTLQILRDGHAKVVGLVLSGIDPEGYMYYENEDGANYYKNISKYYSS